MEKIYNWYFKKYLSDMTDEELEEDWVDIQIGIYCIIFGFAFITLGGIL